MRRSAAWQQPYYALLEKSKTTGIAFEDALSQLFTVSGTLEASFASKLVATADPTLPVIDKFVLANVGLRLPQYSEGNRLQKIVEVYRQLISAFDQFARSEPGRALEAQFQALYPGAAITTTKMIDLVLWQTRP